MKHCDSCEVLFINGVKTHELGCPDSWKDEHRECKECGFAFYPNNKSQVTCTSCSGGY